MMRRSREFGYLVFVWLLLLASGASQAGTSALDVLHARAPAQMFVLANQALGSKHLSARDRARVLVCRGLAREMLGQPNDALVDFNDAIASRTLAAGEQAGALYDRGVTLDELNRRGEAIANYSQALQLRPKLAPALNNRANAYRRIGRLAEARSGYEASIAAGNSNPEYADYGLGQIAEALGQPDTADEYYRAALAANPRFTLASQSLAALGSRRSDARDDQTVLVRAPEDQASAGHPIDLPVAVLKPAINDTAPPRGRLIQIGAWRSVAGATSALADAQKRAGELLDGLAPVILAADLSGKGRYFRLRVEEPDSGSAARLCAALKAREFACILVPG